MHAIGVLFGPADFSRRNVSMHEFCLNVVDININYLYVYLGSTIDNHDHRRDHYACIKREYIPYAYVLGIASRIVEHHFTCTELLSWNEIHRGAAP